MSSETQQLSFNKTPFQFPQLQFLLHKTCSLPCLPQTLLQIPWFLPLPLLLCKAEEDWTTKSRYKIGARINNHLLIHRLPWALLVQQISLLPLCILPSQTKGIHCRHLLPKVLMPLSPTSLIHIRIFLWLPRLVQSELISKLFAMKQGSGK